MVIETSRLILKSIEKTSFKKSMEILQTTHYFSSIPRIYSNHHSNKFLNLNNKIKLFNSLGYFPIYLKSNMNQIGVISVIPRYLNNNLINELGYIIDPNYRNMGYALESIQHLLKYIYSSTNIQNIYCFVHKQNNISKNLLSKLGFSFSETILDKKVYKHVFYLSNKKFLDTLILK